MDFIKRPPGLLKSIREAVAVKNAKTSETSCNKECKNLRPAAIRNAKTSKKPLHKNWQRI